MGAGTGDLPPAPRQQQQQQQPRGRVRLSGFGHVGMGGSVALCDPASGLAFAMTINKVDIIVDTKYLVHAEVTFLCIFSCG